MEKERLNSIINNKIEQAWDIRKHNFEPVIDFYIPKKTLPISLTGPKCWLNCSHCNKHYLRHMIFPEKFPGLLNKSKDFSFLVSGGCNEDGAVPFDGNFDFLQKLKDSGHRLNVHTGLIEEKDIEKIAYFADVVSFDFIVDNETIKEVYHLDKSKNDYIKTYKALRKKVKVIPHICIGLKGGRIKGEYLAISELEKLGADSLSFIIFMPTKNTGYENRTPPPLEDILEILSYARKVMPTAHINVGCMRPKGRLRSEIDFYSIKCGINGIVNPTPKAFEEAKRLNLKISFREECCAFD